MDFFNDFGADVEDPFADDDLEKELGEEHHFSDFEKYHADIYVIDGDLQQQPELKKRAFQWIEFTLRARASEAPSWQSKSSAGIILYNVPENMSGAHGANTGYPGIRWIAELNLLSAEMTKVSQRLQREEELVGRSSLSLDVVDENGTPTDLKDVFLEVNTAFRQRLPGPSDHFSKRVVWFCASDKPIIANIGQVEKQLAICRQRYEDCRGKGLEFLFIEPSMLSFKNFLQDKLKEEEERDFDRSLQWVPHIIDQECFDDEILSSPFEEPWRILARPRKRAMNSDVRLYLTKRTAAEIREGDDKKMGLSGCFLGLKTYATAIKTKLPLPVLVDRQSGDVVRRKRRKIQPVAGELVADIKHSEAMMGPVTALPAPGGLHSSSDNSKQEDKNWVKTCRFNGTAVPWTKYDENLSFEKAAGPLKKATMVLAGVIPQKAISSPENSGALHYKHSYLVEPNEGTVKGSDALFGTLVERLEARKQALLVYFYERKNVGGSLCCLSPCGLNGQNGSQKLTMVLHFLPYKEDIRREIAFNIRDTVGEIEKPEAEGGAQLVCEVMDEINNRLYLPPDAFKKSDFHPYNALNPSRRKLQAVVEGIALSTDHRVIERENLKVDEMLRLSREKAHEVDSLKKEALDDALIGCAVNLPSWQKKVVRVAKAKAKSSSSSSSSAAGGGESGLSEENNVEYALSMEDANDMEKAFKKCKVPELKEWLGQKGLDTTGKKKDLVERVLGTV